MVEKLEYLQVECSSYLTAVATNLAPYLLIFGNGKHLAWSIPLSAPPRIFKCSGEMVYLVTSEGDLIKIETKSRTYNTEKGENFDFAGSGLNFSLTLRDNNVYSKG